MAHTADPAHDHIEVRAVAARDTHPLRQAVLRPHQRVDELAQADDDAADSGSFAAFDEAGHVVGTGVVARRPPKWLPPGTTGWQLRGMAVAPEQRGRGIGSAVLRAILDHVRHHGGGLVWCNARIPARSLYEHAGFSPVGEPFDLELIGPHIVMARRVDAEVVD